MTKFITIASAKGGTGKTTTAINTGLMLIKLGYDALVVDANLETPHIAMHLGSPMVKNTIHDSLNGDLSITKTAYKHFSGLKIIPGTLHAENIKFERLGDELENLYGTTAIVLIDSAAGLGNTVKDSMKISDEIIIVTNPDIVSVTDAMKTIKIANDLGKKVKGIVLNKVKGKPYELTKQNIQELLDLPILATIAHSEGFPKALKRNLPYTMLEPNSDGTTEFKKLALTLLQ